MCVIIQNPVNNTKRDANLLWRERRESIEGGCGQTLCKYFKRAVTITAHPGRVPPYHAHPMANTYVFVRCGAFQFYPFYWLCIFYSCLKFIHKYSDSARIARQSPPPSTYIYSLSFHTSNSNCCMACPIAIPSHPIPRIFPSPSFRVQISLLEFLVCVLPCLFRLPPSSPLWRLLGCVHHLVKLRSYSICIPYCPHTHTNKSNRLVYSICALKSESSTRLFFIEVS